MTFALQPQTFAFFNYLYGYCCCYVTHDKSLEDVRMFNLHWTVMVFPFTYNILAKCPHAYLIFS